jgi:hypothetical protein
VAELPEHCDLAAKNMTETAMMGVRVRGLVGQNNLNLNLNLNKLKRKVGVRNGV